MNKIASLVFFVSILSGCGGDTKDESANVPVKSVSTLIKVYKSDGSKQCDPSSGVAPEAMRAELISNGIDVICSQKGNTGLVYPATCGAETGAINIYQIHPQSLQDAEKLGFISTDELTEYMDTECQQ